jgi:hypothetical protein
MRIYPLNQQGPLSHYGQPFHVCSIRPPTRSYLLERCILRYYPVDPLVDVSETSAEDMVEAPVVQETSSDGVNTDFCDRKNFTEQVSNLSCSGGLATFSATGLLSPSAEVMVGITATNQQYARPHDYMLSSPGMFKESP